MSENNGNGHKAPLPFVAAARQDLPIIGQPFTMKAWFVEIMGTCNCGPRPEPLLLLGQIGAVSGPCPLCGRKIVLQGINVERGQLNFQLGVLLPTVTDGAPAGGVPHVG